MNPCACGCGGLTRTKWLNGHWHKVGLPPEYEADEAGCWVWQRTKDSHGYGLIRVEGKQRLAHRVYYERHKGEIPSGLVLDHLCCVKACVNPEHLEAVTNAENCRRGRNAKLTLADVAYIRASSESHATLGRQFGVMHTAIFKIRSGERWAGV